MKLILRISLFTLCIIMIGNSQLLAATTPVEETLSTDTEILEPQFVQIELSQNNAISISLLKSINNLILVIQSKYYSLLNWQLYNRNPNKLEIENYDRKLQFGRWINDANDDTCFDTRAKVLIRDSDKAVTFKDNNHCKVATGSWDDPYTGDNFQSSADIQIDHFVPLKNAYMSGAYKWSFKARCLYANFTGSDYHLLSANGRQNMKKGDRGPDRYMPPNPEYTCTYIKNWLTIKFLWGLKMTISEADAVAQLIKDNQCNHYQFRITAREIFNQSNFAHDNIEICEKLDQANKLREIK